MTASLRTLHVGKPVVSDAPAGDVAGPRLGSADQLARVLRPGTLAVTLNAGAQQPQGVLTPGLRGLLAL